MATGDDETFAPPPDDGGTDPTTGLGSGEVFVEGFSDEEPPGSANDPLLSAPMGHEEDDTGGLEYTQPGDDSGEPHLEPASEDVGFDGWLGEPSQSVEREDPYAALSDDDAADEIADWMAFTQGGDGGAEPEQAEEPEPPSEPPIVVRPDSPVEPETVTIVEPESQPGAAAAASEPEEEVGAAGTAADETSDEPAGDGPDLGQWGAPSLAEDQDLFVDAEEEGTVASGVAAGEEEPLELWSDDEDDVVSWEEAQALDETGVGEEGDEDDEDDEDDDEVFFEPEPVPGMDGDEESSDADTGEMVIVGDADKVEEFAATLVGDDALDDVAGAPSGEPATDAEQGSVFDFEDFTEEVYLQGATREHAGLAEDVARAATEETEQVPLAAAMSGVETGVVGFEDVVGTDSVDTVARPPRGGSDLAVRVGSAAALIILLIVSLLWAQALAALALVVFLVAGWEFYAALISRDYRPISLFGLLGIAGASIGAYFTDSSAIPIALALTIAAALLFDAVAPRRDRPDVNFSLTILVAAWICLGAFAYDIINAEDWRVLVVAVVALVALVDIAQYFTGRSFGRRQLSPVISPKKTVEGLAGGVVVALALGAALSFVAPFDLGSGLLLGVVVAVFAPVGDLAVSAAKRSLNIKDMGSIVPGHGGILDRIDGLMFVIPAAWVAYSWLGLL